MTKYKVEFSISGSIDGNANIDRGASAFEFSPFFSSLDLDVTGKTEAKITLCQCRERGRRYARKVDYDNACFSRTHGHVRHAGLRERREKGDGGRRRRQQKHLEMRMTEKGATLNMQTQWVTRREFLSYARNFKRSECFSTR